MIISREDEKLLIKDLIDNAHLSLSQVGEIVGYTKQRVFQVYHDGYKKYQRKPLLKSSEGIKLKRSFCVLCGSKFKIHIHHIDNDKDNNTSKNLIVVCEDCHLRIHNCIPQNAQILIASSFGHYITDKMKITKKYYSIKELQDGLGVGRHTIIKRVRLGEIEVLPLDKRQESMLESK